MPYIIMFALTVIAAMADVVTGLLKAKATTGYDSTIMRKGLYRKALNLCVMLFAIAVEVGLEMLGKYYEHPDLARVVGGITAGFVFAVVMLMESISVFENFAIANPNSPLAQIAATKLKKVQEEILKEEDAK